MLSCKAETISSESGTNYIWQKTRGGEVATFTCPLRPTVPVNRSCSSEGIWQLFDEEACGIVNEQLNRLNESFNNVSPWCDRTIVSDTSILVMVL